MIGGSGKILVKKVRKDAHYIEKLSDEQRNPVILDRRARHVNEIKSPPRIRISKLEDRKKWGRTWRNGRGRRQLYMEHWRQISPIAVADERRSQLH